MGFADLAVINARIYTAERAAPWAETMAASDGYIVGIGGAGGVDPLIGPGTRVLDAGGRLVLPGFIDAHTHLIWGYELGSWIDLSDRPALDEVQRRVAQYAMDYPQEPIIIGHGFDYASLQRSGMPHKEVLDEVVANRPVLLTAWDGHTGLGNSAFVARAEAVQAAKGADVGEMERDARGKPTGVFFRAFDLMSLDPEVQGRRSPDGLRQTIAQASRLGITTGFDIQLDLDHFRVYRELQGQGGLTVRILGAMYHPKGTPRGRYLEFAATQAQYTDDWLRAAAVKLYIDGVSETHTAALLEPYADDPSTTGELLYGFKEFSSMVVDLDRMGFQICTHACGDRGLRVTLDAYEEASLVNGTKGRRHRIEHCELVSPDDIPRFARLGVIPCMMPRHSAPELTARYREAVGSRRTDAGFPWRPLLLGGASLALASDWPVADMNPLVGIHEAVNRRTVTGENSPLAISVGDAIDGYTRGAAYACRAEGDRGSLTPGKLADFVVLSDDLFEGDPGAIRKAKVLLTAVGGRPVYKDHSVR